MSVVSRKMESVNISRKKWTQAILLQKKLRFINKKRWFKAITLEQKGHFFRTFCRFNVFLTRKSMNYFVRILTKEHANRHESLGSLHYLTIVQSFYSVQSILNSNLKCGRNSRVGGDRSKGSICSTLNLPAVGTVGQGGQIAQYPKFT